VLLTRANYECKQTLLQLGARIDRTDIWPTPWWQHGLSTASFRGLLLWETGQPGKLSLESSAGALAQLPANDPSTTRTPSATLRLASFLRRRSYIPSRRHWFPSSSRRWLLNSSPECTTSWDHLITMGRKTRPARKAIHVAAVENWK